MHTYNDSPVAGASVVNRNSRSRDLELLPEPLEVELVVECALPGRVRRGDLERLGFHGAVLGRISPCAGGEIVGEVLPAAFVVKSRWEGGSAALKLYEAPSVKGKYSLTSSSMEDTG